eukprot:1162153-Pelagomonas_calceolata.AAC.4
MESPDGLASRSSLDENAERPILSHTDSMMSSVMPPPRQPPRQQAPPVPQTVNESYVCEEDTQDLHLIERPLTVDDVNEITSLLKGSSAGSMLTHP